jgi:hypothetical protein
MDEFRGLSSANISTLITIKKLFCIPSLISCIFLLLLFWFFKEIRGITIENVIYFTLSEIIYSIALLFPYQEHSYTLDKIRLKKFSQREVVSVKAAQPRFFYQGV